MSHTESYPSLRKLLPGGGSIMDSHYRTVFEKYAANESVTAQERMLLRWYILSPHGGRLSALNAIAALRSHHLDALMKMTR